MHRILFQKGRATEGDTIHKPRASSYIPTCTWNIHNPTKSKTETARVVAYAHETGGEGLLQIQD